MHGLFGISTQDPRRRPPLFAAGDAEAYLTLTTMLAALMGVAPTPGVSSGSARCCYMASERLKNPNERTKEERKLIPDPIEDTD